VALTVHVLDRIKFVPFDKLNVSEVAVCDPVVGVPKAPERVYDHDADALQVIVTVAVSLPFAYPDKATGLPALVPPSGLNVPPADLPLRSFIEIAPEETPANARTAESFKVIVAVELRPSSVFT
jgi:hypothetical protein